MAIQSVDINSIHQRPGSVTMEDILKHIKPVIDEALTQQRIAIMGKIEEDILTILCQKLETIGSDEAADEHDRYTLNMFRELIEESIKESAGARNWNLQQQLNRTDDMCLKMSSELVGLRKRFDRVFPKIVEDDKLSELEEYYLHNAAYRYGLDWRKSTFFVSLLCVRRDPTIKLKPEERAAVQKYLDIYIAENDLTPLRKH